MTYHRLFTLLHHYILAFYDTFTCKKAVVSVGDILMLRPEASFVQFVTMSRILDIRSYIENGDKNFTVQDTLAKYRYGERYGKDYHHNQMSDHFSNLIESFLNNGYEEKSIVELDQEGTLTDGTHRVAMATYNHHWNLNAKIVRRISKYPHNIDYYYNLGVETNLMEKINEQSQEIQDLLIANGVTLGCLIYNIEESVKKSLLSDLYDLCDVKRTAAFSIPNGVKTSFSTTTTMQIDGLYILFSLKNPKYEYKKNELVSVRTVVIETILKNRYENKAIIIFMNNCVRGKETFDELQAYFVQ